MFGHFVFLAISFASLLARMLGKSCFLQVDGEGMEGTVREPWDCFTCGQRARPSIRFLLSLTHQTGKRGPGLDPFNSCDPHGYALHEGSGSAGSCLNTSIGSSGWGSEAADEEGDADWDSGFCSRRMPCRGRAKGHFRPCDVRPHQKLVLSKWTPGGRSSCRCKRKIPCKHAAEQAWIRGTEG